MIVEGHFWACIQVSVAFTYIYYAFHEDPTGCSDDGVVYFTDLGIMTSTWDLGGWFILLFYHTHCIMDNSGHVLIV